MGYNSNCIRDISEILASNGAFSGSSYPTMSVKFQDCSFIFFKNNMYNRPSLPAFCLPQETVTHLSVLSVNFHLLVHVCKAFIILCCNSKLSSTDLMCLNSLSSSAYKNILDKKPSCRQDSRPYCQKLQGSRDLGHAHFRGILFVRPLGTPDTKLHTKFEVCSSSSFRDIAL